MGMIDSGAARKIVIIGGGPAGLAAATAARAADPEAEITMFSSDSRLPYYRLRLCEYVGREIDYAKLTIRPEPWFADNHIVLRLSAPVTAIDPARHVIRAADGEVPYDRLVVAAGSTPVLPPFEGRDLAGVHTLWTCGDLESINRSLAGAKSAAVIGGGLLGLEMAYRLREAGIRVTLIEKFPRLLPRQLDEEGSAIFTEKVRSLGIRVLCGAGVTGLRDGGTGEGRVRFVELDDGTAADADLAVVSVGVAPNTSLCRESGIDVERFVVVNDRMETGTESIYAAGDIASLNGRWFGLWTVADAQGKTAGSNAAGGSVSYAAAPSPYVLSTMGTRVVCAGDPGDGSGAGGEGTPQYESVVKADRGTFSYSRLVFRDGRFAGYMLVGSPAAGWSRLQTLIGRAAGRDEAIAALG